MNEAPARGVHTLTQPGRGRRRIVEVFCNGCETRLVVAEIDSTASAIELAMRNARARPCCPLWTDTAELPGQLRLELEH